MSRLKATLARSLRAASLPALALAAMLAGPAQADPSNVQFVVDTGPGGGSDLFARQIVKIATQAGLITENWPVLSQPQGGGLGAMSFMKLKRKRDNFVAAFTSKWVVSGINTPGAGVSLADLTPIVELADEQQMIAVPASSPYKTFADFVADAKAHPGTLVQTGGAVTSVDYLAALQIERNTGTSWKYLSFDGGGPRITALLRGDAQIMIGSQTDFSEQVTAGQLRIVGILGDKRSATYPDVPTLHEQGVSEAGIPAQLQWRGIAGPPGMSDEAVAYYRDIFSKLVKTKEWQDYMTSVGDSTDLVGGDELRTRVADFTAKMGPLVGLLKEASR